MRTTFKDRLQPLWILLSTKWGGPEQILMADMASLADIGVPCSLACIEGSGVHAFAMRHKNIRVYPLDSPPKGLLDFRYLPVFKFVFEKAKPNLLLINDTNLLPLLQFEAFKNKDFSIIAYKHSHSTNESMLFGWIESLFYRRLDYIIVLSDTLKKEVLTHGFLKEKKVKVINLGLDFTRFDPAKVSGATLRKHWGADSQTKVIGTLGKMQSDTEFDIFIKAAAGLTKQNKWKLKFVIVDEDPLVTSASHLEELEAIVRLFHMENEVVFEKLTENLPEVMAAFDIFVMPGSEEVPGLGALEALAMEKPVVLSTTPGSRDIVSQDQFGFLVRPHDAFDIHAKVLKLLENPLSSQLMGTKGRQYVLKHFDRKMRFLRSMDIYERSLKRRSFRSRAKSRSESS